MDRHSGDRPWQTGRELRETINAKEDRKIAARRDEERPVLFGLGMFGLVGWSVAAPTIACVAIGIWIDTRWPGPVSWTLAFLGIGIAIGCLTAWTWIKRESRGPE